MLVCRLHTVQPLDKTGCIGQVSAKLQPGKYSRRKNFSLDLTSVKETVWAKTQISVSKQEGHNLNNIEIMTSGLPIVCSKYEAYRYGDR
jgi:hypothetical protein